MAEHVLDFLHINNSIENNHLCVKYCAKCFACIMSLNPHKHRRKLRHRKGNLLKKVKTQFHGTQKPLCLTVTLCCPDRLSELPRKCHWCLLDGLGIWWSQISHMFHNSGVESLLLANMTTSKSAENITAGATQLDNPINTATELVASPGRGICQLSIQSAYFSLPNIIFPCHCDRILI